MVYHAFVLIFLANFGFFCFDAVKSNLDFPMSYEFATTGKDFYWV